MPTLDKTRMADASDAGLDALMAQGAPRGLRIAYLLSQYPAISHTFFLHEVLGLRARGLHIETASINRPDRAMDALPKIEAEESGSTYYLKGGSKVKAASRLGSIVVKHPAALVRGLRAVAGVRDLTLRQRGYWLFYLAEALLVGSWMRARGLQHLHVHFGGPVACVGMLASVAWEIPYSLTIHGPEELLNVESYHLREKLERARFVFCISDFCRSQLCHATDERHWKKYRVIRLGVDPVVLRPKEGSKKEMDGPLRVVCVGRLAPQKGHRILLEAIYLLKEQKVPVHLTLVGGGAELDALREYVEQAGLSDRVEFTLALSHEETLTKVHNADVFALASFAEGIPVALMEAMAMGVPCVSTAIAGIPELIRDGVDGFLIAPANAQAMASALEVLAGDVALRRRIGSEARLRIIDTYNLPLNQELLANAFETMLAGNVDDVSGGRAA